MASPMTKIMSLIPKETPLFAQIITMETSIKLKISKPTIKINSAVSNKYIRSEVNQGMSTIPNTVVFLINHKAHYRI